MTPIAATLAAITVGQPKHAGRLTVFPLLGSSDAPPPYLLLDEALAKGVAQVTETSTSGSVPELGFENRSDQPILIVDGEALVGAKQNRIVNISILVPAQSITPIPVSCVERGRWSYRRPDFGSADHVLYSKSRAQKASHVSASLRASGRARADQGAIWNDIAEKSERMAAESHSEAMDALFAKTHQDLENLELQLQPEINQVGAAFALDGRVLGLEVFDVADTWRRFARKVYAATAWMRWIRGHVCTMSPLTFTSGCRRLRPLQWRSFRRSVSARTRGSSIHASRVARSWLGRP